MTLRRENEEHRVLFPVPSFFSSEGGDIFINCFEIVNQAETEQALTF